MQAADVKTRRKVIIWGAMFLLLALLLYGTADASAMTDPYRSSVLLAERISNSVEDPDARAYIVSSENVGLEKMVHPSLDGQGVWKVTCTGVNGSQAADVYCYLQMKDYSSDYTTVYRGSLKDDLFTTCTIVTGGSYRAIVFVTFTDGSQFCNYENFSIANTADHPSLTGRISEIVRECRTENSWETALHLHDWLTTHAHYDLNYEYYGADGVLLRGTGVCDSYSKAYLMLCQKAGIPVYRVEGTANGESHAWNAIQIGGEWYHVDPTWDDAVSGREDGPVSGLEDHDFFCLNDDLIGLDHRNNGILFSEPCTSLDANYFVYCEDWDELGNNLYENASWTSYRRKIAEQAWFEETAYSIQGENSLIIGDGSGYYRMSARETDAQRRWTLLAYLMSKTGFPMGDSELSISVSYQRSSREFLCTLKGYKFESTGTMILPPGLIRIASETFMGISASCIIIPEECAEIESMAFSDSQIHEVRFVNGDLIIAPDAFDGCSEVAFACDSGTLAAEYAAGHHFLRVDWE